MTSEIYHGGNLAAATARFGAPAEGWLDLSTGINPVPYPVADIPPADWLRLPERAAEGRLETIAAESFGLADPARLIATPGTQAVIQALPWLVPAQSVAILGFTYQEHAHRWRTSGADVHVIETLDDPRVAAADVVLVVNPNNPDGRQVAVETLLALGAQMAAVGKLLIVDEAFMDVLRRDLSVLPLFPEAGIAVMRSVGKTWGLAGLRLGFFAGPLYLVDKMRDFFGPWSVSGPALTIGARALGDAAWLASTIARLEADCAKLDVILAAAGLGAVGGTPLFRLVAHANAQAIFTRLGKAGILVRPFPAKPDWLRFGIPASDAERDRLREALR